MLERGVVYSYNKETQQGMLRVIDKGGFATGEKLSFRYRAGHRLKIANGDVSFANIPAGQPLPHPVVGNRVVFQRILKNEKVIAERWAYADALAELQRQLVYRVKKVTGVFKNGEPQPFPSRIIWRGQSLEALARKYTLTIKDGETQDPLATQKDEQGFVVYFIEAKYAGPAGKWKEVKPDPRLDFLETQEPAEPTDPAD